MNLLIPTAPRLVLPQSAMPDSLREAREHLRPDRLRRVCAPDRGEVAIDSMRRETLAPMILEWPHGVLGSVRERCWREYHSLTGSQYRLGDRLIVL